MNDVTTLAIKNYLISTVQSFKTGSVKINWFLWKISGNTISDIIYIFTFFDASKM